MVYNVTVRKAVMVYNVIARETSYDVQCYCWGRQLSCTMLMLGKAVMI